MDSMVQVCTLSSLFLFNTLTDFPGLEVNNSKNSSTFSKICEEDQALHDILGFTVTKLTICYLGLPITGKKSPSTSAGN